MADRPSESGDGPVRPAPEGCSRGEGVPELLFQKAMRQDADDIVAFHQVRHEAEFLFGDDVSAYLKKLHETVLTAFKNKNPVQEADFRRPALRRYTDTGKALAGAFSLCSAPVLQMPVLISGLIKMQSARTLRHTVPQPVPLTADVPAAAWGDNGKVGG